MNTTEPTGRLDSALQRGVRPCAWMTWGTLDGKVRLNVGEATTNHAYTLAHRTYRWEPLVKAPTGWRFERDHNNRIVVTMPDGGGCVVDNVANDARMVPEEVLFALCKALGA